MASLGKEPFRALIENSSDAIFLMSPESKITYASASTAKVLGYKPEELLGRDGLDLIHPQDRIHSIDSLKQVAIEPKSRNRMKTRVRRKDGHWLWVESIASNLLDEPHVGSIVLNLREISSWRAADSERQHHSEELARSNIELQAFAHTIAHDLREPLRTIACLTELLVRKTQLNHGDQEIGQYITDGVKRMSTLLDDLLSSAACGSINPLKPVELGNAAQQAVRNLTETVNSSATTITVGPLPTVQGHESDLIRVFQNLIGNAVKYRSESGPEINITAERPGPDWIIKIRDNGIGIAKEQHDRIFGLFTRLQNAEIPGTGIGLAVCKKIVEGLGGKIWVESVPGAGSTFCFSLPAASEAAMAIDMHSCSSR